MANPNPTPLTHEARVKSGLSTAAKMTPEERSERARKAAASRWTYKKVLEEAFRFPLVITVHKLTTPMPGGQTWEARLLHMEMTERATDRNEAVAALRKRVAKHVAEQWTARSVVIDLPKE